MLQQLKPEINFCACGCEARLVKEPAQQKGKFQYTVQCLDDGCGNESSPAPFPWQAILEWNKSVLSEFPDDFKIPFINLAGLSAREIDVCLRDRRNKIEMELKKLSEVKKRQGGDRLKILRLQLSWVRYGQSWSQHKYSEADLCGA